MADTEQEGAPSATAGGAPAPTFDHESAQESVRRLAQLFGMSVADVAGPPFRPNCRCQVTPAPDPRDAELAQLRTALARYQKRMGDDLLCGGKLVERVRAALRVDDGGTCTRASMNGVVGDVGRLCDETERLRGELDKANTGWEVWRDEQRARDKRRDNELRVVAERLHELIGDTEPCAMAFISTRHLHGLLDHVVAERDRLRQELDLVGEQHAAGLVTLRTDFTAAVNGLLPKLAEPNRQGCPCKSQCDYLDGEDRCSDSCDCAAGRRWVAGDPEPEIGTLITWGSAGSAWERHGNGWKTAVCQCKKCSSTIGLTWPDLLAYAPLVEVVTSDG